MAKRFTDTDKYKKPFIRSLKGAYKLFWDYLYHDCNHAGIWIADFEIAQIYLGSDMPINRQEALEVFNKDEIRVIEFDGGSKWFIKPFIDFQYGQLNENNRVHKSVIDTLSRHRLIKENKPLTSPLQRAKDKDMDKDKDKEKDKEYIPTVFEVEEYFKQNGYSVDAARKAYNMYNASIEDNPNRKYWRDSRDNPIKNWKLKMQSVWFKDENKVTNGQTVSMYEY
jgi:hypothetical protein